MPADQVSQDDGSRTPTDIIGMQVGFGTIEWITT